MKNFNDIYEKVYKECNEELEILRKERRNKVIIVAVVVIIIGFVISKFFYRYYRYYNTYIFLFSICIVFIYASKSKKGSRYNLIFKEKVIKTLVKEYSSKLTFENNRGIAPITYSQAEFERFDKYESEDLISGTLEGGYIINIGEVKTQRVTRDQDGDRTTETLFHGLFANVKLDKILRASIKIRKNGITLFKGQEKLEMDSGEFERKFNVYTTDKIVAMQLLTADVMQMLLDFKERNNITPEITIKRNNLYIRFSTGEVFEGTLMKSALDYSTLKKYFDIINFTLNLIECFSKNISEAEI